MTSFHYWASILPDGFFMCCLCFESHPIAEASTDEHGVKWDVCIPCAEIERVLVERKRAAGAS